MKIKTLIISAVLASSSIFAAEPLRLTAANLEAHNRLHQSASTERLDSDQRSDPSTIAAGQEDSGDISTIARIEDAKATTEEPTWNVRDVAKTILDQATISSKKLGIFLAKNTAKHGALIAVETGLTRLTLHFAHELLTTPIKDIDSDMFFKVAPPALFLGAQTLFSSFLLENTHRHFISTPVVKWASVGFQAAYMLGLCSGQAALFATGVNLIYMLLGEAEPSAFRR